MGYAGSGVPGGTETPTSRSLMLHIIPGKILISLSAELLLPKTIPTEPSGIGPNTPVPKAYTPICGINTAWVGVQRSNPALPEVS